MRISDWSTDVCSSDLDAAELQPHMRSRRAERPLVWTYPSGRKALLVGYTADEVVGMPRAEGRALLMRLLEWAAQPAFSYSHQWQERSEEHTSELQSLMRISYAVFCLKKKNTHLNSIIQA